MRETVFDSDLLSKWWRHFELERSTLIWAPRQSGKTFAMVRKMVEEPDSVICVPFERMKSTVNDYLMMLGCPDRRRDVFTMRTDALCGRTLKTVYIDEIDMWNGDLEQWWMCNYPVIASRQDGEGRIIACSTPNGVRPRDHYRFFHNHLTLGDMVAKRFMPLLDHFKKEKELFTI